MNEMFRLVCFLFLPFLYYVLLVLYMKKPAIGTPIWPHCGVHSAWSKQDWKFNSYSRNYKSKARKIWRSWKMKAKFWSIWIFRLKKQLNWQFLGLYSSWPPQLLSSVKGARTSLTERDISSWIELLNFQTVCGDQNILLIIHDCQVYLFLLVI